MDESLFKDFRGVDVGVDVGQGRVILRPEEDQGREERAGAHARHELKLRTIAMSRPTDQQSSAEGSIIATTRERQHIGSRQGAPGANAGSLRFANEGAFLLGNVSFRPIGE